MVSNSELYPGRVPEQPRVVSIESEKGRVEITEKGAKVTSWKVRDSNETLQELFYQGVEKRQGMPNLVPGYRDLTEFNKDLPQHGFGRDVNWVTVDIGDRQVTMELDSSLVDPKYQKMYPLLYKFRNKIEIDSEGNMINTLSATNLGKLYLPIAPGLHPNFAIAHQDKKLLKVAGIEGFNPADIDFENNTPDNPYPYRGGPATAIFPDGKIVTLEDITPGGRQIQFMNVWTPRNPANPDEKNFVTWAEPLTRLDNGLTRNPILVAPGETWDMKLKFSASFPKK